MKKYGYHEPDCYDNACIGDCLERTFTMSETICIHCHKRIVKVNFLLGESWRHQPAGSSFNDNIYEYCHMTVAEPPAASKITIRCQHRNQISSGEKSSCGCMIIDDSLHPCRGCPATCGNCL